MSKSIQCLWKQSFILDSIVFFILYGQLVTIWDQKTAVWITCKHNETNSLCKSNVMQLQIKHNLIASYTCSTKCNLVFFMICCLKIDYANEEPVVLFYLKTFKGVHLRKEGLGFIILYCVFLCNHCRAFLFYTLFGPAFLYMFIMTLFT